MARSSHARYKQSVTWVRRLPYKYLVAIVFIFGLFMDLMDPTVVNVALPTLNRQFNPSPTAC